MLFYLLFRLNNKHILISLALCSLFFTFQNIFKTKNPTLPVLVWWTPFYPSTDRVIECDPNIKCLISNNHTYSANAYLFYGSRINNSDFPLPRNTQVPWAVFHEESPKNYAPILFDNVQDLFNITSTFSRKSQFPVPMQYLSLTNLELLRSTKYYISVQKKNELLKKLSPIVYVQSDCDTPIDRDYLVSELSKYVAIDSYGLCLKNKTFPDSLKTINALDLYNEEYLKFLAQYKFIIAFENAVCDDYVTEKFWRPLIVGSIPIYSGSPTIKDWLPNKNSAIVVDNFKTLKTLADFINEINVNDTLYEGFLEHKMQGKISNPLLQKWVLKEHPLLSFECHVCKNIKSEQWRKVKRENIYKCPEPTNRKENTWNQHWEIGRCQAKALRKLIENGKMFTNEQFEELWKKLYYDKSCYD